MRVQVQDGTVTLKKLGRKFATSDVERIAGLLGTLGPFSQLVLDLTAVRECDDAALLPLVKTLEALTGVTVVLRGLTRHEARLLKYLGLRATEVSARA